MTNEFGEFEKLRQRRPQAATIRVSTKVTRKSKSLLVSMIICLGSLLEIWAGPLRCQLADTNSIMKNKTRTGTWSGTGTMKIKEDKQEAETQLKHEMEDGKQEAKVESEPCHRGGTKPFSWDTEKGEEGRQAPQPEPEPGETRKSRWNRTSFLRQERREKKGDKHRNQSRNHEKPANHDGTRAMPHVISFFHCFTDLFVKLSLARAFFCSEGRASVGQ